MITFVGPYPQFRFLPVVRLSPRRMIVAVLDPMADVQGPSMDWDTFEKWAGRAPSADEQAGIPDFSIHGAHVHVPRHDCYFLCRGRITFDLDGPLGYHEWTDFSIWDFQVDFAGRPLRVANRIAETVHTKADFSARYRGLHPHTHVAQFIVPFAEPSLLDVNVCIVTGPHGAVGVQPDVWNHGGPGREWPDSLPRFENVRTTCPSDFVSDLDRGAFVSAQMIDPRTKEPIRRRVTVWLDADKGYVPYRKVETNDNGVLRVHFMPLGLQRGDVAKITINGRHFTGLGDIEVEIT